MNNKVVMTNIWSGRSPKKTKFFIWELIHNCITTNERYQKRSPWICLSPSCCLMCLEASIHLFVHCPYIKECWNSLFNIFGWQIPLPGDIETLITALLLGHPFKKEKKILWECFICVILWKLWLGRNDRSFNEKARNIAAFMDSVIIAAISWNHLSPPFELQH